MSDAERLDNILSEIHKHGGLTTLHSDYIWLEKVQREKPVWAVPIFEKYKDVPHAYSEALKQGTRK